MNIRLILLSALHYVYLPQLTSSFNATPVHAIAQIHHQFQARLLWSNMAQKKFDANLCIWYKQPILILSISRGTGIPPVSILWYGIPNPNSNPKTNPTNHNFKTTTSGQSIWHKAASPPHTDGSVVFARWRQCAPHVFIAYLDPENPTLESNSMSLAIIHYSSKFKSDKANAERQTLKFNSRNIETYNTPFSIDELLDALSSSNDSAVAPEDIHYQMLKHLPSEVLNTLLSILNDIWLTGNFPSSWRQSYVVPIRKPGKDTSNPTHYRPIALTSFVCKVMESMVNNRQTCMVYGKKQNYHSHTEWFPQRSKHRRPASTLRTSCPRGFYPEATRYCYFLWSRKGVRHNLEAWHLERLKLTRYWPTRPTPTFHSRLPVRQKVPSPSWWKLFQTLRTGNGGTSEKHPICYSAMFEN